MIPIWSCTVYVCVCITPRAGIYRYISQSQVGSAEQPGVPQDVISICSAYLSQTLTERKRKSPVRGRKTQKYIITNENSTFALDTLRVKRSIILIVIRWVHI